MTSTFLSPVDLAALVTDLVAAGTRVIAPVLAADARRAEYRRIERLEEAALRGPLPRRSLKEFFLPPSEVLLRYRQRKSGVELEEVPTTFAPQVVLGARPCDAAAVEIVDKVMGWDRRDELWFGRRDATTIVSLACPGADSSCFCSAVGLAPDATRGADASLVALDAASARPPRRAGPLGEAMESFLAHSDPFTGSADAQEPPGAASADPHEGGGYLATAATAKGEALLAGRGRPPTPADVAAADLVTRTARARVARTAEQRTRVGQLPDWLARNFDHPLWKSLALRCHGCGACAAVCGTCHCFDIVDEHDRFDGGARRRNWDSCSSAKFTLHASGHNPRATQTERLRQRVMHKFSIFPRRFDAISCTGCGRCARVCAAGMNLPAILGQLARLAEPPRSTP